MKGPKASPFEGGNFKLEIDIKRDYPFKPPGYFIFIQLNFFLTNNGFQMLNLLLQFTTQTSTKLQANLANHFLVEKMEQNGVQKPECMKSLKNLLSVIETS